MAAEGNFEGVIEKLKEIFIIQTEKLTVFARNSNFAYLSIQIGVKETQSHEGVARKSFGTRERETRT